VTLVVVVICTSSVLRALTDFVHCPEHQRLPQVSRRSRPTSPLRELASEPTLASTSTSTTATTTTIAIAAATTINPTLCLPGRQHCNSIHRELRKEKETLAIALRTQRDCACIPGSVAYGSAKVPPSSSPRATEDVFTCAPAHICDASGSEE
jgi:uncharacterized membrane protein